MHTDNTAGDRKHCRSYIYPLVVLYKSYKNSTIALYNTQIVNDHTPIMTKTLQLIESIVFVVVVVVLQVIFLFVLKSSIVLIYFSPIGYCFEQTL